MLEQQLLPGNFTSPTDMYPRGVDIPAVTGRAQLKSPLFNTRGTRVTLPLQNRMNHSQNSRLPPRAPE